MKDISFYKGKKVLLTGHTGFKGSWLCRLLLLLGADITGYALEAPTTPNLFGLCNISNDINSIMGDVRDLDHMDNVFREIKPEIVIHLAAQPLVLESYRNPVYTYETNVMGTVNMLECIRKSTSVHSFLNITTDKVYKNNEWEWGYRENEVLDGFDPYSNSKSCSELITGAYQRSFLNETNTAISTARAGNVIGGGDFAADRIIPDCIRAAEQKTTIILRNPFSIRPYQHVLEPLVAYLLILMKQYKDNKYAGNYNIGPDDADCKLTSELAALFCETWNRMNGDHITWKSQCSEIYHEASYLKLDCSRIKKALGWKNHWNTRIAVEKIVEWSMAYIRQENIADCMDRQIIEYLKQCKEVFL